MAMRRSWLAVIAWLLAAWLAAGCSDSGSSSTPEPAAAGMSNGSGQSSGGGIASGGMAGAGGTTSTTGGAAPNAGMGGGAGARSVPMAWTCPYFTYGDGHCDCGCAIADKDCTSSDIRQCEVCGGAGSCSPGACPGRIDPADVTKCLPVPTTWTCDASRYGDGKSCDCGCGAVDLDCPDTNVGSCTDCAAVGACGNGPCPSAISAEDNTRCEVPPHWWCSAQTYGDGVCNCGCGVLDVDCADATRPSCETCDETSCSPFACSVAADDNSQCPEPPTMWLCSDRLWADGSRCDCGCGAIDPDCETPGLESCDDCDSPGSCSGPACPGTIEPEYNGYCQILEPPEGWTCEGGAYADGISCDCGCGLRDPDCRSDDVATCARCLHCGGMGACEGTIDPEDMTQCGPPPPEWICSAEAFRDGICDCGCGMLDSYCQFIELRYVCANYPVEGCTAGNRSHIDPSHNERCIIEVPEEWTCDRTFYDDGFCDCGCGVPDLDCPSAGLDDCETCDAEGSCSEEACPGSINPNEVYHCTD
jgi:hypothetical protein